MQTIFPSPPRLPNSCQMHNDNPPPFVPFLSFSPLPIPCSSALCFASVVANLHRPFPLHQITNKPHPNALHCGSPLLYPLLLITRFSPLLQFLLPFLPLFPLSFVCTCSLRGCFIGVDSARTIGAAVSNDRTFTLGLDRCGIWLPSNVQLGNGVGRQCEATLFSSLVPLLLKQHCVSVCVFVYVCVLMNACECSNVLDTFCVIFISRAPYAPITPPFFLSFFLSSR